MSARWEVAAISIDLPQTEDAGAVVVNNDGQFRREMIEADNSLFAGCNTAWDVADQYEAYWNRLNNRDESRPYGTHRPRELVKVLWVRRQP